jgi:hypothetical protein
MQRNNVATPTEKHPRVIESLADGLSLALARPWLLLVPMLLDLYYWLGWKVSAASLASPIGEWILRQDQAESADVSKGIISLGRADATQLAAALTPSLLAGTPGDNVYSFIERTRLTPDHWAIATLLIAGFLIGACLLHMVFVVPLADAAIDRNRTPRATTSAIVRAWWRSIGLHLTVVGIGALLLGPAMIASLAMIVVGIDPTPLLGIATIGFSAAGFLVWWFALKAIAVNEVGPFRALKYGFMVVRHRLWPVIGFVAAWLLISLGLGQLWLKIAISAPGLLVGVIANAFFAAGVTMAGLIFYRRSIDSILSLTANPASNTTRKQI